MLKLDKIFIIVSSIVLFLILPPQVTLADWPMFRYDFNHTGTVPYRVSDDLQQKWVSLNISFIWNPPAVDYEGNIYISTENNRLVAFDKDGHQKWTFTGQRPNSTPTIDDNGNIYYVVGLYSGYLYSLDKDGHQRWVYHFYGLGGVNDANRAGFVTLSKDKTTLYVTIGYPFNGIAALSLDGSLKWSKRLDMPNIYQQPSAPVVEGNNGTLYVGTGNDGRLYALTKTGIVKWYISSPANPVNGVNLLAPIIGSDQNIYTATNGALGGDWIISFTPQKTIRWSYQFKNKGIEKEMAVFGNRLFVVTANDLYAFDMSNGNSIWQWSIPYQWNRRLNAPVIDKNGIIYTSMADKLYAINPDGTTRWEKTLADYLTAPIIAGDDLIYVGRNKQGTWEGYLYALGKHQTAKVPVIFIPGIGGSELKTKSEVNWSTDDGHGGTYTHTYPLGEKIWVNDGEAIKPGSDDYFDILRLKADGQTSEADLELTGDMYSGAYQSTINFFTSNGYILNQDLFIFPYDWRKDLSLTRDLLNNLINSVKQSSGHQKVDIVTHSMGGLVARNYIADFDRAQNIRKLITLGTPHLGAVDFLKYLRYGGCMKFEVGPFCLSLTPSELKDVIRNMPGGFELAPTRKYFDFYSGEDEFHPYPFLDRRDIDNNGVTGPLNYEEIKTLLGNLGHNTPLFNFSEAFHNLDNNLPNTNGVEINIIVGSGIDTLGQIIEGYLVDFGGIKIPHKDLVKINGDETVPLLSASLTDPHKNLSLAGSAKIYYTNQRHSNLPSNGPAMNMVLNILDASNLLPAGISLEPYQLKGHELSVHSPVNIHVYDASNNHTGPLPNGDFEANIPGSNYETLDDAKFIWLPDGGIYTIKFEAEDQGSFDFKIRNYQDDINNQTILYKNIPLTTVTKAETIFDTNSTQPPILQIDEDGNGTIDLQVDPTSTLTGNENCDQIPPETEIKLTGDLGNNNWYKSDIIVELAASDEENGSGILKTEYSLDNGQTIQTYSGPFTITTEGISKLKFRSIDQAGNEENPQEIEIKIDKTPPEAKIMFDLQEQNFKISGTDNLSDVQVDESTAGEVILSDQAGNSTELQIEPKEKKKKDRLEIKTILYNSNTIIEFPENKFEVKFTTDKQTDNIKEFKQKIEIKKQIKIEADYNPRKDLTKIEIKEPKEKRAKQEKDGLIFLQLLTNKGQLEIKY